MITGVSRCRAPYALALALAVLPVAAARADEGDDGPKKPDMHEMAAHPGFTKVHKDFSAYRYRPAGDIVKEQPDTDRLMFWTKEGQPDGYAQRRGDSIIYYNAAGNAIRVQRLQPGELD
ncbi:hypothetical protein LOC54_03760 [Acetobacter sp. AN02]|uniref:hypothetical protein n=1 Tax=Acetobacter sp. AN02 TaxID=2894186 RepID=UPI0024342C78|nr:hypothetical protein [Acetobacter sp. AN02]MDG6094236.1 hypothetical protein [Acetobacter sp. AN02]